MVLLNYLEEKKLLELPRNRPSVSVILPFEPKMSSKNELEYRLQRVLEKVQRELSGQYQEETVRLIIGKLRGLINKLDFSTYKRSIAFFVSPQFEKLYYLDIVVEEKIIVDSSFEIRDLVYNKKDIHPFLLLVISAERSRIFLGDSRKFTRISAVMPEHVAPYRNDISGRVANFSDPARRKEILLDKFLRQVDNGLGIILNAYGLPIFVMGTERVLGHFKRITHHADRIVGFVTGNADDADEQKIRKALSPHIADWKKVKQDDLLHQVDAAMGMKKLATGVRDVWREAHTKKGRLLVVELNFRCNSWKVKGKEYNCLEKEIGDTPLLVADAVDDIIEKVLESGGDVEFVDDGLLEAHNHIALIQYYR